MEVDGQSVNFSSLVILLTTAGVAHERIHTPEQESFNVYFSAAHTCVEIVFWKLKARWRILYYSFPPYLIVTCCTLHNFCEKEKDQGNPRWMHEATILEEQFPQPGDQPLNAVNADGQAVREALKSYMAANFPLSQGVCPCNCK